MSVIAINQAQHAQFAIENTSTYPAGHFSLFGLNFFSILCERLGFGVFLFIFSSALTALSIFVFTSRHFGARITAATLVFLLNATFIMNFYSVCGALHQLTLLYVFLLWSINKDQEYIIDLCQASLSMVVSIAALVKFNPVFLGGVLSNGHALNSFFDGGILELRKYPIWGPTFELLAGVFFIFSWPYGLALFFLFILMSLLQAPIMLTLPLLGGLSPLLIGGSMGSLSPVKIKVIQLYLLISTVQIFWASAASAEEARKITAIGNIVLLIFWLQLIFGNLNNKNRIFSLPNWSCRPELRKYLALLLSFSAPGLVGLYPEPLGFTMFSGRFNSSKYSKEIHLGKDECLALRASLPQWETSIKSVNDNGCILTVPKVFYSGNK